MHQTSAPSILRLGLTALSLIVVLQPWAPASAAPVARPPAGLAADPASPAGCQWTYYPVSSGHLQAEQLLYNDPDNTPIANLSAGNPFKGKPAPAASLSSTGSADLNDDGKTDVFRTIPFDANNLRWQYSNGGTGAWQNLIVVTSRLPTAILQFGEFDGDAHSDIFANDNYSGTNHWEYSKAGLDAFTALHTTASTPLLLALGDFNGDGISDVFTATFKSSTYQWGYFPGGTGSPISLAQNATNPQLLRFGDFNGDHKTDVFGATRQPDGSTQWWYANGGIGFANLVTSTVPYAELQLGDFNGDGTTDVLAALPAGDGGLQLTLWPGGLGAGANMGHIPAPAPALRVGDFNGDGTMDLLALRCGMAGPLTFAPLQILANSGYEPFFDPLTGDVNGDGRPDLIQISNCQNPGSHGHCATNHLLVSVALGQAGQTHTLLAPQLLGPSDVNFSFFKPLAGDFDGDGKTDLALVGDVAGTLTIYLAHSNGDGSFTMGAAQSFLGTSGANLNPVVGDFNGDGKADLAFTTVCYLINGGCGTGTTNSVTVALAGGGGVFSLGARQDLSLAPIWGDYVALAGDFNGDGKTDLVFNSTCEKVNSGDLSCTVGTANLIYTALSMGGGTFGALNGPQNHGSGWSDYFAVNDRAGDLNGDRRSDLIWSSNTQSATHTTKNLAVAGLANPDGTFQLGSVQQLGSAYARQSITLADVNHDGRADLLWNQAPLFDTDVDTYGAATSNGDGTFHSQGTGAVYTGPGRFQLPDTNALTRFPTGLTLVSTDQDLISDAFIVVNSATPGGTLYLPLVRK